MTERAELEQAAIDGLRVRWVVRQQIGTVQKRWLVDIFDTESERIARLDYERLAAEHPSEYFELVAVMHSEVCSAFTKDQEPSYQVGEQP